MRFLEMSHGMRSTTDESDRHFVHDPEKRDREAGADVDCEASPWQHDL